MHPIFFVFPLSFRDRLHVWLLPSISLFLFATGRNDGCFTGATNGAGRCYRRQSAAIVARALARWSTSEGVGGRQKATEGGVECCRVGRRERGWPPQGVTKGGGIRKSRCTARGYCTSEPALDRCHPPRSPRPFALTPRRHPRKSPSEIIGVGTPAGLQGESLSGWESPRIQGVGVNNR